MSTDSVSRQRWLMCRRLNRRLSLRNTPVCDVVNGKVTERERSTVINVQ